MINKNTKPGSTVWYVQDFDNSVNRIFSLKDDHDAFKQLIQECKIITKKQKSLWNCPGYFWIDFVSNDLHSCLLFVPQYTLFSSFRLALDQVSSNLQLRKKNTEKEISRICAFEQMISEMRTKEIHS